MKKLPIALALTAGMMVASSFSCANNTTSTGTTLLLDVNGNSNGCTVIAYVDHANPVTEFANGQFSLGGVNNGSHSVSVFTNNGSGNCTFDVQNVSHDTSIINPCVGGGGAFQISCN